MSCGLMVDTCIALSQSCIGAAALMKNTETPAQQCRNLLRFVILMMRCPLRPHLLSYPQAHISKGARVQEAYTQRTLLKIVCGRGPCIQHALCAHSICRMNDYKRDKGCTFHTKWRAAATSAFRPQQMYTFSTIFSEDPQHRHSIFCRSHWA